MKKKYLITLLFTATFGIFPFPAQGQYYDSGGERAVSQQGSQSATVNGSNNNVKKHINVVNINRFGRGGRRDIRRGNRGIIQSQNQGVDVRGDRNSVRQTGQQFNRDRNNSGYVDLSI